MTNTSLEPSFTEAYNPSSSNFDVSGINFGGQHGALELGVSQAVPSQNQVGDVRNGPPSVDELLSQWTTLQI